MGRKMDKSYIKVWRRLWGPVNNADLARPQVVRPKVDGWASKNFPQMPYFIKVIRESSSSRRARNSACQRYRDKARLRIPGPFVRENFRELQRTVTLEDEAGNTWRVSFISAAAYPEWHRGWTEFSVDNKLVEGDIVLFVLIANSRFRITLFDKDETLKKTCTAGTNKSPTEKDDQGPISSSQHVYQLLTSESDSETRSRSAQHSDGKRKRPSPTTDNYGLERVPPKLDFEDGACDVVVVESDTQDFNEGGGHGQNGTTTCEAGGDHHQRILPSHPVDNAPGVMPQIRFPKSETGVELRATKCKNLEGNKTNPKIRSGNTTLMEVDPLTFIFISKRAAPAGCKREAAKHAAEAYVRTLKRANFMLIMEESHVYRDFHLELPDAFVAEVSLPAVTTALGFVDSTGQSWEMHTCRNKRNKYSLHRRRWALFSIHHFLEEGDACAFELMDRGTLNVGVRIFRIQPLPNLCRAITIHDRYDMRAATYELQSFTKGCSPIRNL